MKNTIHDYRVSDSPAAMRNKLANILDFTLRGLECNTHTACDGRNNETIRNYHEGKAQAYREILTFFERYIKEEEEDDEI